MAEGEFFIQMVTCHGNLAEATPPPGEQYDQWATYADLLLTGQPLPIAGLKSDEHPVKVTLAYDEEGQERPTSVASMSLLCPCNIEVIAEKRARSALLDQPQQKSKIATPQLIVPR